MTVYSVYTPQSDDDSDLEARADRIAFVKDGFSWPALFVPVLWLLYQRMWLELLAFLLVVTVLQWALGPEPHGVEAAGWVTLALTVLFASEANDLRGWALERRGYRFAAVVSGRDRIEAERSFFTTWLAEQQIAARRYPPPPRAAAPTGKPITPTRQKDGDEVIGSFPQG